MLAAVAVRRKAPVCLVSNATTRLERDLDALGLRAELDVVINSSRVGARKPDRRIFAAALDALGARGGFFVDDNPGLVDAARALPLRPPLHRHRSPRRCAAGGRPATSSRGRRPKRNVFFLMGWHSGRDAGDVRPTPCASSRCSRPARTRPARSWLARLEVTTRTVRNDVERLRALGYPVHATRGRRGATAWGRGPPCPRCCWTTKKRWRWWGCAPPPRAPCGGSRRPPSPGQAGAGTPRPPPAGVQALQAATVPVPWDRPVPAVEPAVLTTLAGACATTTCCASTTATTAGRRAGAAWSPTAWWPGGGAGLVAWDTARHDWRTFRVDRIEPRPPTGPASPPRPAGRGHRGLRLPARLVRRGGAIGRG